MLVQLAYRFTFGDSVYGQRFREFDEVLLLFMAWLIAPVAL
jgi:hypothetical protein